MLRHLGVRNSTAYGSAPSRTRRELFALVNEFAGTRIVHLYQQRSAGSPGGAAGGDGVGAAGKGAESGRHGGGTAYRDGMPGAKVALPSSPERPGCIAVLCPLACTAETLFDRFKVSGVHATPSGGPRRPSPMAGWGFVPFSPSAPAAPPAAATCCHLPSPVRWCSVAGRHPVCGRSVGTV
jgi:hypothetical protein